MDSTFKHHLGKDFCVLERVPEFQITPEAAENTLTIIDLETTGLNYKKDGITEIGVIKIAYTTDLSQFHVVDIYQQFNDSGVFISKQIAKLTGITNEMVKDKTIDWEYVKALVHDTNFIVCHNAAFDRKFLEQTPIGQTFKDTLFACSKNDIDWPAREYASNKLDYLNWKMGYFYDAHRAINDCWATLNILLQEGGALQELIDNTNDEFEVYAEQAPYAVKDRLKQAGFFWNNGQNGKPKAWFKVAKYEKEAEKIISFINDNDIGTPSVLKVKVNRKYSSVE
jgi:DNA polymerase-3 subunit epsilon